MSYPYCDYKLVELLEDNNNIKVIAVFFEGQYEDVEDPITEEVENVYIRKNKLFQKRYVFDKETYLLDDIQLFLNAILNAEKGDRDVIPEQE